MSVDDLEVDVGLLDFLFPSAPASKPLMDRKVPDGGLSLHVVFPSDLRLDVVSLERSLRAYSRETKSGVCQGTTPEQGSFAALIGWGTHVIRMVGFNVPMPSRVLEKCVAPAHYDDRRKADIRAHKAHVVLYYTGQHQSRLEQYVALAAIAGVLAEHGALAVLNDRAWTSLPAEVLAKPDTGDLELLRTMPLPMLFVGMVKVEVEGSPGVWMRTYGADALGLTDFAHLARDHRQGESTFGVFNKLLTYQLKSGARFADGQTAQIGANMLLGFRAPERHEYFLQGGNELLVILFAPSAVA